MCLRSKVCLSFSLGAILSWWRLLRPRGKCSEATIAVVGHSGSRTPYPDVNILYILDGGSRVLASHCRQLRRIVSICLRTLYRPSNPKLGDTARYAQCITERERIDDPCKDKSLHGGIYIDHSA